MEISDNGVAATVLTQEHLKTYGIEEDQTHGVISLPSTVEGIHCWGLFVKQPDGTYRVNLRSKGPIVNTIALVSAVFRGARAGAPGPTGR